MLDDNGVGSSPTRILNGGENLHFGPNLVDPRGADEDGPHRVVETVDVEICLEGINLPAERVPLHHDVEHAELWLNGTGRCRCQEDHAGACPEHRHPRLDPFAKRLHQTVESGQTTDRRRLATRDDQRSHRGKVLRSPDLDSEMTESVNNGEMLAEIALESERSDPHLSCPGLASAPQRAASQR